MRYLITAAAVAASLTLVFPASAQTNGWSANSAAAHGAMANGKNHGAPATSQSSKSTMAEGASRQESGMAVKPHNMNHKMHGKMSGMSGSSMPDGMKANGN
jgi:hypothetical protein